MTNAGLPDKNDVLVSYRLEQADEALSDAEFLFAGHRSARSVINRSYYAAYYAVLALHQKSGFIPKKHTGAIAAFDSDYIKTGVFHKERSRELHYLFNFRQMSDYQVMNRAKIGRASCRERV